MTRIPINRKLGWLEGVLLVSGCSLLLAFFLIKTDQEQSRTNGLNAFYQKSDELLAAGGDGAWVTANEQAVPNQNLWSEQRVLAYEKSLQHEFDLPRAVLRIDSLDIEVPVYNGTDEVTLDRGVGRIIGTARIDDQGNLGIAGHRDGFFRGLKDIQKGELIELQTTNQLVRYRVTSIVIVDPTDVSVLAPSQDKTLTLVTCYPFYFVGHAPKRYIVKAAAEQFLAIN